MQMYVFISECMYESGCALLFWVGMCAVWGIWGGAYECEGHGEGCSPQGLGRGLFVWVGAGHTGLALASVLTI